MTRQKSKRSTSFKQLIKQCSTIEVKPDNRFLLISSPQPEATLATALLSRAIQRFGSLFHITFVDVLLDSESINNLRKIHSDSITLVVGTEIIGKKNLRKGRRYPTIIGGSLEPKQDKISVVGGTSSIAAAAYAFAKEKFSVNQGDLQIAAAGALIQDGTDRSPSKTSEELISLAIKEGVLEKRKGLKIFGTNFMALKQSLLHSTYPFLPGISGEPQLCEKILDDADIPLTKRGMPLTSLDEHEMPRLSGQLVQIDSKLKTSILQMALGRDYVLVHENRKSPLRLLSGIRPLALTAWSRWILGLTTGVLMGDRSKLMENLVNIHKNHSEAVISVVRQLLLTVDNDNTDEEFAVHPCPSGTKNETLADVARVLFEIGVSDREHLTIFHTKNCMNISWYKSEVGLNTVLRRLKELGLNPHSSSAKSVQISSPYSEISETILKAISDIRGAVN